MSSAWQVVHGIELEIDCDMVVRAHNERSAGFEPMSVAVWIDSCSRDGLMIDAGSYTGIYSFVAEKHGCDVLAFEPNLAAVSQWIRTADRNGCDRSRIRPSALGSKKGWANLSGKSAMSSASSVTRSDKHSQRVQVSTIDSEVSGEHVAAIKIDVEGSEAETIFGGMKTIDRCRPTILVEILGKTENVDKLLFPLGYCRNKLDATMFCYAWGEA